MNSFFQRRIGKAKDQMDELENEVKLLHLRTKFISEKGLTLLRNINSLEESHSLEEYTSVHGYLSKYTKILSEFNCNLEMLLFTDGFMNELDDVGSLEYSLEKGVKEKKHFNFDYFNNELQLKELRVCTHLSSAKYTSSKEKLKEPVTSIKPNEWQEEKKNSTDLIKNEEGESSNDKTEVTDSEEAEKNLAQKTPNSTGNSYKILEYLSNDKKNVNVRNSVEFTGYPVHKARNFDNYNVNSGSSAVKPESMRLINQFRNLPPFMNGSTSSDNNYLHIYPSNGFPAENNYWQIPKEMKKQFKNIPFNSGPIHQYQAEPYNFNRLNRQNFYFPPIPSQQNINFWNNEYHYSNFQSLNPPPNQIIRNPSMQHIYPYQSNIQPIQNQRYDFSQNYIRWPGFPNAFSAIQRAQCASGIPNFGLPIIPNESQSSQQTSKLKKIKSNSTNRKNGKTDENPKKDSMPENKESLVENSEKEPDAKCDYSIRLLNFNREIGLRYNVNISYLDTPSEFYVHVNCEELDLMSVMNNQLKLLDPIKEKEEPEDTLSSYCSKKVDFSKNFGSYALGYSVESSSWNRLKILDWRLDSEDEMVRVFLIDHGNTLNLPFSMIQPINSVYMNYPQFAQKCYLSGISNATMSLDFSPVSLDEIKAMFEVLLESAEKDYRLAIEIVEVDDFEKNESLGVRLYLSELDICVNDKLRMLKTVAPTSGIKNDDCDCVGESSEYESLEFGSYLPLFSIGERVRVKVTCILRVNRFFCVKDYREVNETDVLMKLAQSLNDGKKTSLNAPPKIGELILGKYTDLLYYRAKVIRSEPNADHYKVLFLDYGNTEQVSLKDMKKMTKKDLKIPFQMIECYLDCIEVSSEVHEPLEAIKYLANKIEEGSVTIEIKRILNNKRGVYGVDIFDKHGNNICRELVSEEYCVSLKKN